MDDIWQVAEARVADGRIPGYVGAVRLRGREAVRASGRIAVEADAPPMREDTQFRIASLSKLVGGALTLGLVEDGVLALEDPVARWLPELAAPRLLDGTPAKRPITVRHLMTMTCGWGAVFEDTPIRAAMKQRGVFPGPRQDRLTGDQFVAAIAEIPLSFHPGEGWLYDTGATLLSVLLTRATGRPLATLVAERVTGPLGMSDTAFFGAANRLAAAYTPRRGKLELADPPDGRFASPPPFEQLSGGLVSTAGDLLRFLSGITEIISADSLAQMTADALTPAQRESGYPILDHGFSWGLLTGVEPATGAWGWVGGTGTTASVDPSRDTIAILLTQREMTGPQDGFDDFHAAVAAAAR